MTPLTFLELESTTSHHVPEQHKIRPSPDLDDLNFSERADQGVLSLSSNACVLNFPESPNNFQSE